VNTRDVSGVPERESSRQPLRADRLTPPVSRGGLWDDVGDAETLVGAKLHALELPRLRSQLPAVSAESLPASLESSALRKRILAPAWWCEGLLVKHSAKDALTQHLAACVPGRVAIVGPALQPKHVHLLWSVWHDLVAISAQGVPGSGVSQGTPAGSPGPLGSVGSVQGHLVRIPLGKHLRGTAVALAESMRFLVQYWASPFQVFAPKSTGGASRKGKGPASRTSSVNFVRFCTVEATESPELILELALPLVDFVAGRLESVLPSFLCEEAFASKGHALAAGRPSLVPSGVVSANPDVLRAFGTGASFRKLVAYLYVEYAKLHANDVFEANGWQGRGVSAGDLEGLHEGMLQRTKALYDHGVFGWENAAPRGRVRDLRKQGSVVHCWRLSSQARQATELESILQTRLFEARPLRDAAAEIVSFRRGAAAGHAPVFPAAPEPAVLPATRVVREAPPEPAVPVTRVAPPAGPAPERQGPLGLPFGISDADDRLFLCVLEYYSSLTQGQQRMFQTQRARMSDDEFRAYVLPLLKRRPV
jgi:hypothetical protein